MNFTNFLNLRFTLLDAKKNRLFLVLFFLVYSLLFLNIFVPFNMNNWVLDTKESQFIQLSAYSIIGATSLAFSQFFLRKWFNRNEFLLGQFLVWIIFELLFLTTLLTLIYSERFEFLYLFSDFIFTLKHTFLIAIVPYSIVLLILSLFQSKSELLELKKERKKIILSNEIINFSDENGNVKFTLQLNDLIYLESTDNYVYIHYHSNHILKKELLRNSLKNLENDFKKFPIKRCHRSYMVNLENLNIVKKTGQKIEIKLNYLPNLIPVSRSYYQEFKNYLQISN